LSGVCALAVAFLAVGPVAGSSAPLRILPLGDSITRGSGALGGCRAPLYTLLTNAGYNVDFVGTLHDFSPPSLPDPDHEGHSGWRIDQIDAIILSVFQQIAGPDVILLLIGTNDYGQDYDTAHAAERLEALIAKMAVNRPSAVIIVANLLVRNEPQNTAIETTFNTFVPHIVARQAALGRQVYFTDLRSCMGYSDLADNVHPNLSGYMKIATNWFTAITNLFPADGGGHVPLVTHGATCSVYVPTNDALGLAWTSAEGFDDSGWIQGFAPVGYENPRLTYTNYIRNWVPSGIWGVYVRWPFVLPAQGVFEARTLTVRYDDGFVAYLNGIKVAQTNAPEELRYDAAATAAHRVTDPAEFATFDTTPSAAKLHPGTNVLAIHVLNHDISQRVTGLLIDAELKGTWTLAAAVADLQPAPGGAVLSLKARAGSRWRVEASPDLVAWSPLASLPIVHGRGRREDSALALRRQRFYRLRHSGTNENVTGDCLETDAGDLIIHPVFHAGFALVGSNAAIFVDPATNLFADLPAPNIILYTHSHPDHFNADVLPALVESNTVILAPPAVCVLLPPALQSLATALTNGGVALVNGLKVEAVPMYNTGVSPPHPPGEGNGYVLTIGGRRIYIAGDSSATPEMRAMADIDVAFVNVCNPWMTPAAAAEAIRAFRPRIVYPCHARGSDLECVRQLVGTELSIEVRVRQWR